VQHIIHLLGQGASAGSMQAKGSNYKWTETWIPKCQELGMVIFTVKCEQH
jgi:hypothetical protein